MYAAVLEIDKPIPEWMKIRLFTTSEKAIEWAKKLDNNYMSLMGISEDTQMCSTYSCGHTIKIKKVIPDEEVPENLKKLIGEK